MTHTSTKPIVGMNDHFVDYSYLSITASPEFFLHNYDSKVAVWQNRQINVATSLAGIGVNTFFFKMRSNALQRLQEAQMKLREFDQSPQERLGRVLAKDNSRVQLLELAERYFGIADSETDKVLSYGDLPESMKDWLRTGDASFFGNPITDHDGLALAYQEAFHPMKSVTIRNMT